MPRHSRWSWLWCEKSKTWGKVHYTYNCRKKDLPPVCHNCGFCADFLCDYPIGKKGKTCDAPLCVRCRHNIGEELDYCKAHFDKWQEYRNSGQMAHDLVSQKPQNVLPDKPQESTPPTPPKKTLKPQVRGQIKLYRRSKK